MSAATEPRWLPARRRPARTRRRWRSRPCGRPPQWPRWRPRGGRRGREELPGLVGERRDALGLRGGVRRRASAAHASASSCTLRAPRSAAMSSGTQKAMVSRSSFHPGHACWTGCWSAPDGACAFGAALATSAPSSASPSPQPSGKRVTSSPRCTDRQVNVTGVGGSGPGSASPGSRYATVTCGCQSGCSLADRSSRLARNCSAPGSMTGMNAGTLPSLPSLAGNELMPDSSPSSGPGTLAAASLASVSARTSRSSSTSAPR